MSVFAATQAFGSEPRVHLIHYFAANPDARQVDAVNVIGADRATVSFNVRALLETGVLVQGDSRTYRVDEARFRELIKALEDFGSASSS